ncbi:MAG TPA: group 1 truncated hemoglobin [Burkholderiaceae bacterium]|nr:group 1 truncated hemoglobin [Burkholderiaceae bacterium]
MPHRRLARALLAALPWSLWLLAGCTASPPAPGASLYERLGGQAAIAAMLDDALGRIAADPRISQRFGAANPDHLKRNLVDLVCARAGGPCVYKGRNMADAHDGMQIRDDEFDAMTDDIAQSFDKFKVPTRERRESLAILGQMRGAIVGH